MITSNITGKKASKAPNDKSKYIPLGLLARGRGRQLRDVYTSNVQLEDFAKSGFKSPIGASKKISCYDSSRRPNHLGSMKDYSVRVSTSFDAPFNPKSSSAVKLNDAAEHDNISSSKSNREDVGISSSENEDLHPLFDYNNMILTHMRRIMIMKLKNLRIILRNLLILKKRTLLVIFQQLLSCLD